MKIIPSVALNINGVMTPSGFVVDVVDAEAKNYVSSGLATPAPRGAAVEVETRVVEAAETADAPRTRKRPAAS